MILKNLKATLIALTGSLLLTACGDDRFPDYRYKMTVYVGDKAFSSVREVEVEEIASILHSSGKTVKYRLKGEAVILDLASGPVFALLSKPDNPDFAMHVTGPALKPVREADEKVNELDGLALWHQRMVAVQGPHDLPRTMPANDMHRPNLPPRQSWPMFVAFDDPKDPKTVREVSPSSIGVKRITIEITDEDVTTGIEGWLEWLSIYPEPSLNPSHGPHDRSLSATTHHGAFRAGANQ